MIVFVTQLFNRFLFLFFAANKYARSSQSSRAKARTFRGALRTSTFYYFLVSIIMKFIGLQKINKLKCCECVKMYVSDHNSYIYICSCFLISKVYTYRKKNGIILFTSHESSFFLCQVYKNLLGGASRLFCQSEF